jgi:A/G-specific adenine glycosylase
MNFSEILLEWYAFNKRVLPWRNIDNPYFIWLSEIILQQTRVDQGLPYYLKFTNAFPTVTDLAEATEDSVLKLWQGLGYYSRARNLHFSAKYIVQYYNGVFPTAFNDILNLKGVGTYTAAAIASFSFGLPYAVVDGNVIRVLSRFFGITTPFDTTLGKKKYQDLAQDLLNISSPAENNQAIMEFGAIQCTPKSPKCCSCPLISNCVAFNTNSIHKLPVKLKKLKIKNRYLNYLVIKNKNAVILGKRHEGIWKGLYEFPFIEYSNKKSDTLVVLSHEWITFFKNTKYEIESVSHQFIHKLSHQLIFAKFWTVNVKDFELERYSFIKNFKLKSYPVSRLTDKFLKEYNII